MYFLKQRYERIVPAKSDINRFGASHDIDLFSPIYSSLPALCTVTTPNFSPQNCNAASF